ncbi:hypothetical protein RvY_14617-2 [Ramazzottius varieornatus]|uniref:Uncharacterized protein n=1 Tax=Ramazzottius varieornatus TaxID=947166 RepID=A0A1D1VRX5_RAMVA|nr:hypothetical protein RvY_14617-2 [Ramazzottius varieornatus]
MTKLIFLMVCGRKSTPLLRRMTELVLLHGEFLPSFSTFLIQLIILTLRHFTFPKLKTHECSSWLLVLSLCGPGEFSAQYTAVITAAKRVSHFAQVLPPTHTTYYSENVKKHGKGNTQSVLP